MDNKAQTIAQIKAVIAHEEKEIARLKKRRATLEARPVRDEKRKQRFLRRLDQEINVAISMKIMAEANLQGLTGGDARG